MDANAPNTAKTSPPSTPLPNTSAGKPPAPPSAAKDLTAQLRQILSQLPPHEALYFIGAADLTTAIHNPLQLDPGYWLLLRFPHQAEEATGQAYRLIINKEIRSCVNKSTPT